MAHALRLLLLLLLAVALPARAAQAAPLQVRGGDEHARKPSPGAWLHEDFQPLKPPEGVSAAKTFQAPFLVAAHKPRSHGRDMEAKPVVKIEFPGGSSGSLTASAAGRETMAGTGPGDEHARKPSPGAWLHEDFQPLKPPTGVSAAKTFQAPFLVAAHKPRSHGRGPPRRRNKPIGDRKSLEASKHMHRNWSDLERQREMEGEPVLKAAFPRGSSGSLAASAAGREALPGTGPGDWERDFHHWETLLKHSLRMLELGDGEPDDEENPDDEDNTFDEDNLDSQCVPITEPLGDAEGVSAGRTLVDVAHKSHSHGRGPPRRKMKPTGAPKSLDISKHLEEKQSGVYSQRDAAETSTDWKSMRRLSRRETLFLIQLMTLAAAETLCLMMCYAGIWYCSKRKRSTSGQELEDGGCTSHPDSVSSSSSSRNGPDSPLKSSVKRTPEQQSKREPPFTL